MKHAPLFDLSRVRCIATTMTMIVLLASCGAAPSAPAESDRSPGTAATLSPWRTVLGGFLTAPGAGFAATARPGTGAFVKLLAPTAVALRGNELLIVDSGAARVWRVDLALNTISPIGGAPATPATAVALGPDLSAWILDGVSGQVLRFARDGRLMQTYRVGRAALSTVAIALVDGGATLLVADDTQRQWFEFRPVGTISIAVQPGGSDGRGVRGVDGLASTGDLVYVLDRASAVVHLARRDGQVQARLGEGELKQPTAIAVDRFARVLVHDAQDRAIKLLSVGRPAQVFDAAQLRVQLIGGLAVDERLLAVTDRLTGQVVIHVLPAPQQP